MSGEGQTEIEEFEAAMKEMSPEERAVAEGVGFREAIIGHQNAIEDFNRLGYDHAALKKVLDMAEKNIDSKNRGPV